MPGVLRFTCAFLWLSFAVGAAYAEEAPGALAPSASEAARPNELDALVDEALDHTPSLAALRLRLLAAKERIGTSSTLPDPTLEISAQEIGVYRFARNSSFLLEYRQGLPYPGKRAARKEASQAEAAIQGVLLEDLQRKVVAEVKTGYAEIYALDAELRSLKDAAAIFETLAGAGAARLATGQAEQTQYLKITVEKARLDERRLDLEGERAKWLSALSRLRGAPEERELGEILALPELPEVAETAQEAAQQNASEVAVGLAYQRLGESRVREARLDQEPDFMLGLGAGMDGMPQPMIMLRFGFELPVWGKRKQAPLLRAAGFESQAARQDLLEAQARTRAKARQLYTQWRRDTALVAHYRDALLPQSLAALQAAQASYRSARGDFKEVAEALALRLQVQAQAARREAERFITWAALEELTVPIAQRAKKGETP